MDDPGKWRVYDCVCGCHPVRPPRGDPKPCDHCFHPLAGLPYEVADKRLHVSDLLAEAKGRQPPRYLPEAGRP